jgi:hypothetical protein
MARRGTSFRYLFSAKHDVYPGPLFPRGEGRRRGPLPKPTSRNIGGVCWLYMNAVPPGVSCIGNDSPLCLSRPSSLNSAQNSAISRRETFENRRAKPLKSKPPSHSFQIPAAVAFSVHRCPVDDLTSSASPSKSSQTTSLDRIH